MAEITLTKKQGASRSYSLLKIDLINEKTGETETYSYDIPRVSVSESFKGSATVVKMGGGKEAQGLASAAMLQGLIDKSLPTGETTLTLDELVESLDGTDLQTDLFTAIYKTAEAPKTPTV